MLENLTPLIVLFVAMFPGVWQMVQAFLQALLNIGGA